MKKCPLVWWVYIPGFGNHGLIDGSTTYHLIWLFNHQLRGKRTTQIANRAPFKSQQVISTHGIDKLIIFVARLQCTERYIVVEKYILPYRCLVPAYSSRTMQGMICKTCNKALGWSSCGVSVYYWKGATWGTKYDNKDLNSGWTLNFCFQLHTFTIALLYVIVNILYNVVNFGPGVLILCSNFKKSGSKSKYTHIIIFQTSTKTC